MRDKDPTTGCHIQSEPLGIVYGACVYGYVTQNPGKYVDPRGEQVFENYCSLVTLRQRPDDLSK